MNIENFKEKFFVCNRCLSQDCLYNYKNRCYCYKEEKRVNKFGDCLNFIEKGCSYKNPVSDLIETDLIQVPGYMLGARKAQSNNDYKVKIEKYYYNRCLVSYTVNEHKLKTNLFNIDIINNELKRRKKEWEKETEILNRIYNDSKFKLI